MDQQSFYVHTDLLQKFSQSFKPTLEDASSVDDKLQVISLRGHHPEIFQVFVHFLYTGLIFSSKEGDFKLDPTSSPSPPTDAEWTRLMGAWVLGETLSATPFKDACVDALIVKMNETGKFPPNGYTIVYNHGTAHCGMHRLCVDVAVWRSNDAFLARCERDGKFGEYWFDVAVALKKARHDGRKGEASFTKDGTCYYHDHGDEEPCYKTMF